MAGMPHRRRVEKRAALVEGDGSIQRLEVSAAAFVLIAPAQRHHARQEGAVSMDGLVRQAGSRVIMYAQPAVYPKLRRVANRAREAFGRQTRHARKRAGIEPAERIRQIVQRDVAICIGHREGGRQAGGDLLGGLVAHGFAFVRRKQRSSRGVH